MVNQGFSHFSFDLLELFLWSCEPVFQSSILKLWETKTTFSNIFEQSKMFLISRPGNHHHQHHHRDRRHHHYCHTFIMHMSTLVHSTHQIWVLYKQKAGLTSSDILGIMVFFWLQINRCVRGSFFSPIFRIAFNTGKVLYVAMKMILKYSNMKMGNRHDNEEGAIGKNSCHTPTHTKKEKIYAENI